MEHVFWVGFFVTEGRGLTKVIPVLVFQWFPSFIFLFQLFSVQLLDWFGIIVSLSPEAL